MKETHEHAVSRGKVSRKQGNDFEKKVRSDLEKNGWIVCKWGNNIETKDKQKNILPEELWKLCPAKHTFNPFTKAMTVGHGFPDFVCIRKISIAPENNFLEEFNKLIFTVQFIESKMNGVLEKIEKQKIEWVKKNLKIPVILAKKGLKRGEIIYEEI